MAKELIRSGQYRRVHLNTEEDFQLNNEQIQELNELYENTVSAFKAGSIIQGTVIKADSDNVLVDVSYKSNGSIPAYEFSRDEIQELQPGSTIEVMLDQVENAEGNVVLSYEKAKTMKAWNAIFKLHEENKPVTGKVLHKVKGGLSVDIGIPAFLPGSQVDLQRVTDFDQFVDQSVTANIIKINQKRGNVIISRRKYLYDQRSEARKQVIDTLEENQVIQGMVKNITNYGVFIDVGGVDGLLHITDMTWGRITHPSEMVKLGDTISVKILSFDKVNEKISLGLKQLTDNPWKELTESLEIKSQVTGKISSITDYGLFIQLRPGVEGLIHISEISWTDRISNLNKKFSIGQEIDAVIVSLDKESRRMSLSIKQLEKNPWLTINEQYDIGQKITGTISNVTDFGVFVQLAPGVDGLVHISDFSWTEHIEHPSDRYKKGDSIEVAILSITPETKKVSLGVKQLKENPWENIQNKYAVGAIVEGEVSKITDFGAFVRLDNSIEGLVHISEFGENKKIEDTLNIGDKSKFKIIKINPEEHKLALSLNTEVPSNVKKVQEKEKQAAKAKVKPKKVAKSRKENDFKASSSTTSSRGKSQLQLELEKLVNKQEDKK